MVDTMGLIPAEMIDFGSKLLKPLESYCGVYLNLQERIEKNQSTEKWKLMQRWVNDGVPFAGEAFRQWIRDFYQENKLIQNQLIFDGRILSLKNIKANILLVAAKHDHIVTEEQTKSALSILGSKDKTYEVVPTGHISVVIGKKAHTYTFPLLLNWLQTRSN